MDKQTTAHPIKKIILFIIPILSAFFILLAVTGLKNIFNGLIHSVLIVIFTFLAYGLYRAFETLYWQVSDSEIRLLGEVQNSAWLKYYLYSLAILLGFLGVLTLSRTFAGSLAPFSASGFVMFLEWSRRGIDQKALLLLQNAANEPPNIHRDLCSEINAWDQSGILGGLPLVADVGKLSELIIAEGSEDANDRPEIEEFFAGSMKDLIGDLASLRKLLLGEAFLTDVQKQDIESLKAKIEHQKDALQILYQRIVG